MRTSWSLQASDFQGEVGLAGIRDRYISLVTGYALGAQVVPSLFAATPSVASVSIAAAFGLKLDRVGLLFLAGNGGPFCLFS